MKILVDTNVVLDVLLKQEPFYNDEADFENSDIPCMSPANFIKFFKSHL